MAKTFHEKDADLALIKGKKVQTFASGHEVTGLRSPARTLPSE